MPTQRVVKTGGRTKFFVALQAIAKNSDGSDVEVVGELVSNRGSNTRLWQVTVLAHANGTAGYIVANSCGEIRREIW